MWERIKDAEASVFKRHTGVKKAVFGQMVEVLKEAEAAKATPGRPSAFSIEDQLLITLEYLREYRTYFHIARSWGGSESTISRIVRRVEDRLIAHKAFHLPGRKALLDNDNKIEVVVVDATESPIERPKKNRKNSTVVKRSAIP